MALKGYILIALAGIFWGTLGSFTKFLYTLGLTPEQAVFIRLFSGFIILFIIMAIKDRSLLKIDKRGIKYTLIIGLVTQSLFNLLYFGSIKKTSIMTAVVLLYTAPAFLIVFGRIFYNEKLSIVKIASVILCITGCFLTVTGGNASSMAVSTAGIIMGVGAGFCYSMVTIIGKKVVNDYNPLTLILYNFLFGWIFLIPVSKPWSIMSLHFSMPLLLGSLGLGLIPTVFSYIFYFNGLSLGVEASKAGIISSLEIVISVILSVIIFNEGIGFIKLIGILVTLLAIVLVQLKRE